MKCAAIAVTGISTVSTGRTVQRLSNRHSSSMLSAPIISTRLSATPHPDAPSNAPVPPTARKKAPLQNTVKKTAA
ncbi:hypothetical protein ABIE51_001685 [Lysobacter sp. OAE881]